MLSCIFSSLNNYQFPEGQLRNITTLTFSVYCFMVHNVFHSPFASCCTNLSLLLYIPMALNYGAVPASPILQSYRDASLIYYEQLLTPHGMSPML